MAQQVRLRNSLYGLLLAVCSGCQPQDTTHQATRFIRADTDSCQAINGTVYLQEQPFTGVLYQLYNPTDTAFVQPYSAGQANGHWRQYYPNGGLRSSRYFDKGYKTGVLRTWWPNGQLQQEYHFEADEYEGSCSEWNAQGQLIKDMHYHRGHEEGPQQLYYDNGTIRANYVITNGRRYGLLGTKNCVNVREKLF